MMCVHCDSSGCVITQEQASDEEERAVCEIEEMQKKEPFDADKAEPQRAQTNRNRTKCKQTELL